MNRRNHIESLIRNKWNTCVVGYSHLRSTGTDYYFIEVVKQFSKGVERISIEEDEVKYYGKMIREVNVKKESSREAKKASDTLKRREREARKLELRSRVMDSIKSLAVEGDMLKEIEEEVADEDISDEGTGKEDSEDV